MIGERTLVVSLAGDWDPVSVWLEGAGIPSSRADAATAARLLSAGDPQFAALILLVADDVRPGHGLCRQVRSDGRFSHMPVLWVAQAAAPVDLYEAFHNGASDYVAAPAEPMELLLRLRSLIRRSLRKAPIRRLEIGDVVLDLDAHQVQSGTRRSSLTPRETAILRHLAGQHGQPSSTEDLLVKALGYPPRRGNPEVVRTHVRHLREKIESDPSNPEFLVNVPRVGYRLVATAPGRQPG